MSAINGEEISVSTANGYIQDFIEHYFDTGKVPVKSMIMDADLIRNYLSNEEIRNVKFMLGERTVDHNGAPTPTLTIIVTGYDSDGNYITNNGMVPDHTAPCPHLCPTIGDAANDFIS